jgi:hypothetical protein
VLPHDDPLTGTQMSPRSETTETPKEGNGPLPHYQAPRLFVIGRAADLVQSGYGTFPDSHNSSVNRP